MTDDVSRRFNEHKTGGSRFTKAHHAERLIYAEEFPTRTQAEARERQIKGWTRAKKEALIRGDFDALRALARGRDRDGISIVRPSTSLRVR